MKSQNDLDKILEELRVLLIRKHVDYGPMNIAGSPGGPMNGLRVRMWDKLARLSNLIETKSDTPNFESVQDTLLDLANYAIIGLLVQRGQWEGLNNPPKPEPKAPGKPHEEYKFKEGPYTKRPTNPVPGWWHREPPEKFYP